MTQYSLSEVKDAAEKAGFRNAGLIRALAVANLESGYRSDAIGYNRDKNTDRVLSRDRGVWQINSAAHPEVSDAVAFDLYASAKEAYRISKGGTDWSAWTTWRNGGNGSQTLAGALTTVVQQLGISASTGEPLPGYAEGLASGAAVDLGGGINVITGPGGAAEIVGDWIKSPIDFLRKLADPKLWVRVLQVVGGIMLLAFAIGQLLLKTDAGQAAVGVATKGVVK